MTGEEQSAGGAASERQAAVLLVWRRVGTVAVLALGLAAAASASVSRPAGTYADAGRQAVATLLGVYYHGDGLWNECDRPNCSPANSDWGVDSLTYVLSLRWQTAHDPAVPPVMAALTATAPSYPAACTGVSCRSWSDVPEWDAIAAARAYEVTARPGGAREGQGRLRVRRRLDVYALGACPDIRYQQPFGQANRLKTLETDANAVKAAILLHQATGEDGYLRSAITRYAAIRAPFPRPGAAALQRLRLRRRELLHAAATPLLRLGERGHDLERSRAVARYR